MGLALVRAPDGRFLREPNGELLTIPQLALARSGLPGTITNGNTPQGLFTIVGSSVAPTTTIGPTPFLHSKLPVRPRSPSSSTPTAARAGARRCARASCRRGWRSYGPFREAWLAGRAEATTDLGAWAAWCAPRPTTRRRASCLARPLPAAWWRPSNGTPAPASCSAVSSCALAQAYARVATESLAGYLVVVEVDALDGPVTPDEALASVLAAGRSARPAEPEHSQTAPGA